MFRQLGLKHFRRLAFISVLLVVAGCGGGSTPAPYTDEEGNYRVLAVGSTKSSQQKLASQAGELTVFAMESVDGNKTSRSVTYTDYPLALVQSRRPEAMLDGLERAMTPDGRWSIESQRSISIDGHPGRELQFSATAANNPEKGAGRARIYLVGNRLYQVIIVGPAAKVTAAELDDFVNSFELLRKVAVAAPTAPGAPAAADSPQIAQAQPAASPAPPASSSPPEPAPSAPEAKPDPETAVAPSEPSSIRPGPLTTRRPGLPAAGNPVAQAERAGPDPAKDAVVAAKARVCNAARVSAPAQRQRV